MKKLKLVSIDPQSLHHAEFGQFIARFFEDFAQSNLNADTDADFKLLFEQLKAKNPTYGKALEQIRENENSQKIAELDRERDNDFQALKDSIKPYKNAKKDEQKQAYNTLKIVFDEYKNVASLSYEEETKKLSTLIAVLKSADNQPHISALRILEFLAELEKSNTAFDTLFAQRSAQNISKETYNTKALRREMTEIYRKLCVYTETLANIKQDDFYKKALEIINNSRKYYADTLAKRRGVSKGKKKAEEKENKGE